MFFLKSEASGEVREDLPLTLPCRHPYCVTWEEWPNLAGKGAFRGVRAPAKSPGTGKPGTPRKGANNRLSRLISPPPKDQAPGLPSPGLGDGRRLPPAPHPPHPSTLAPSYVLPLCSPQGSGPPEASGDLPGRAPLPEPAQEHSRFRGPGPRSGPARAGTAQPGPPRPPPPPCRSWPRPGRRPASPLPPPPLRGERAAGGA